jgi:hypothetical protein
MVFPQNIIGGAGISKRIVQPGETIYVWAGAKDDALKVGEIKFLSGGVTAARTEAMGERMVVGTIVAPTAPGVYELACGNISLGSVTVEKAHANPQTIAMQAGDSLAKLIAGAPAGSTIILPRGETAVSAEIYVPLAIKLKGFGESVLVNRVPKNGFMFSAVADMVFEGVSFIGPAGPPVMQRNLERSVDFVRCVFERFGVRSNNSWLPRSHVIGCDFRAGSGVLMCSGAIVSCTFSGRPRAEHPVSICSDECLIAFCRFEQTERAIVGMGKCGAYAIAYNVFETWGQTNQRETILFEDTDATNGIVIENLFRDTGGPALQYMGATRPAEIRANFVAGNRVSGCHTAFVLSNLKPGKKIGGNFFHGNYIRHCAQAATLFSTDGSTTGNVFSDTTVVEQVPAPDNTGAISPEGANPSPVTLTGLVWDAKRFRVISAGGEFLPAHAMCMIRITGEGWPDGWNQITAVKSATEIEVRNPPSSLPLTGGTAKIGGVYVFESSDAGNVVSGGRIVSPYSRAVFSERISANGVVIVA